MMKLTKFNKKFYRPSQEVDRQIEQTLRNRRRLLEYMGKVGSLKPAPHQNGETS